jgi:23S rRNA G2445 N2-methylase RlmL
VSANAWDAFFLRLRQAHRAKISLVISWMQKEAEKSDSGLIYQCHAILWRRSVTYGSTVVVRSPRGSDSHSDTQLLVTAKLEVSTTERYL